MTVNQKFVNDMEVAGISTHHYLGRFFWQGPAVRTDQQNGPTLQNIIEGTDVPLQWDGLNSNYVVYPAGRGNAEWAQVADAEEDDDEQDGYTAGYATTASKDDDEDED